MPTKSSKESASNHVINPFPLSARRGSSLTPDRIKWFKIAKPAAVALSTSAGTELQTTPLVVQRDLWGHRHVVPTESKISRGQGHDREPARPPPHFIFDRLRQVKSRDDGRSKKLLGIRARTSILGKQARQAPADRGFGTRVRADVALRR